MRHPSENGAPTPWSLPPPTDASGSQIIGGSGLIVDANAPSHDFAERKPVHTVLWSPLSPTICARRRASHTAETSARFRGKKVKAMQGSLARCFANAGGLSDRTRHSNINHHITLRSTMNERRSIPEKQNANTFVNARCVIHANMRRQENIVRWLG